MATARERLLQSLTAIISQAFTPEAKVALKRLLNTYRVQAKPGEVVNQDLTARDVLANQIAASWMQKGTLDKKDIELLISPFRMQLKQGLMRGKFDEERIESPESTSAGNLPFQTPRRSKIQENINRHQNAYFRDKAKTKKLSTEQRAIAGGPIQKAGGRGQCPKCRSTGVVLARAYGGEDYYSCIYCGYQAYLKSSDPKIDLPLAAELLSVTLGDPEQD